MLYLNIQAKDHFVLCYSCSYSCEVPSQNTKLLSTVVARQLPVVPVSYKVGTQMTPQMNVDTHFLQQPHHINLQKRAPHEKHPTFVKYCDYTVVTLGSQI